MKERPILFSAPAATDKTPEALRLADWLQSRAESIEQVKAAALLRSQHQRIQELEKGLQSAISVCNSVSTSIHRRVIRDGCVMYLQTEEWCKWAEEEVQAELRALLSTTQQEDSQA